MRWKEWEKIYRMIESYFNFPREKEYRARDYLSRLIGDNFVRESELKNLIGDEVYVVGFSPNLEKEIELIPEDATVLAADDAAVILHQLGIEPRLVLTDLDGDISSLLNIKNAVFGIHAHGDNIHLLHNVNLFQRRFGTTQVEPVWNVYNFGGFTDGDRCVFLAAHFNAHIHIVGFDFKKVRVKEGKDVERKRKKLLWAKYLIDEVRRRGADIIWENLNGR